jgi:hypothetical protein
LPRPRKVISPSIQADEVNATSQRIPADVSCTIVAERQPELMTRMGQRLAGKGAESDLWRRERYRDQEDRPSTKDTKGHEGSK